MSEARRPHVAWSAWRQGRKLLAVLIGTSILSACVADESQTPGLAAPTSQTTTQLEPEPTTTTVSVVEETTASDAQPQETAAGTTEMLVVPFAEVPPLFGSGQRFSVRGALRQIPITEPAALRLAEISVFDLLGASAATGTSRPTELTDVDGTIEWLDPMVSGRGSPVFVKMSQMLIASAADPLAFQAEVGFTIFDVDAVVEILALDSSTTIFAGDLDISPAEALGDGVFTIGQGADNVYNLSNPTVARPVGRPLRLAESEDLFVVSRSTPDALAWLDPHSPRADTDLGLMAAATALDHRGVVGAALFRGDFSASPELQQQVDELGTSLAISTPFHTLALGWRAEEGQAQVLVVYVVGSAEEASAAVAQVEEAFTTGMSTRNGLPVADRVTLTGVVSEGNVVVATLGLPADDQRPALLYDMARFADLPFRFSQ